MQKHQKILLLVIGLAFLAWSALLVAPPAQAQGTELCFGQEANNNQGTLDDDVIIGTDESDDINGGIGDDSLCGRGGDDQLFGGIGSDMIDGEGGNDTINGGPGDDTIIGGPGSDEIRGGLSDDTIFAADGEVDNIVCGAGIDDVEADTFDVIRANCENVSFP
ncbi:MAG: calcium-binding protein [Ardenticatenaceae bacterium]